MDDGKKKQLESCKIMLRSCLLPEKDGIPVRTITRSYEDLVMERFPYREFGFSNPEEFIVKLMPDVARKSMNRSGEPVFKVVVNEATAHIANLVSKQKSKKKKPGKPSYHQKPRYTTSTMLQRSSLRKGPSHHYPVTGYGQPVVKASSVWHSDGMSAGPATSNQQARKPATSSIRQTGFSHVPAPRALLPTPLLSMNVSPTTRQLAGVSSRAVSAIQAQLNYTPPASSAGLLGARPKQNSAMVGLVPVGAAHPKSRLNPPPMYRQNQDNSSIHQTYYAPSPPPEMTVDDASDPPSNIREDLRQKLERLRLKSQARDSSTGPPPMQQERQGAGDAPATKDSIRDWLLQMLDGKAAGLWSSYLDDQYKDAFGVDPPQQFIELANDFSDVVLLEKFGSRAIIYAKKKSTDSDRPVKLFQATSLTPTNSVHSVVGNAAPDELKLPSESTFMVCVEHATSPTDVVIRIIGPNYSEKLEAMEEDLIVRKGHVKLKDVKKNVACIALISTECEDGEIDESLFRVKILDIVDNKATVELLDHYDIETVPVNRLFEMPPYCRTVPYQAIKCCLSGSFSSVKDSVMSAALDAHVLGKTLQATVDKRTPNLYLTLTDLESDTNVNSLLASSSSVVLEPRIPEVGESRDCSISYISDNGVFYLHFDDPGFNRLLQLEETFTDDVFKNGQHIPSTVQVGSLYAVRATSSSNWSRALVIRMLAQKMVKVQFIDYGDEEIVSVEDVRSLPNDELSSLPYQAVPCLLVNLPPSGASWTADVATKAWSLLSSEPPPATCVKVISAAASERPMIVSLIVDRTRALSNELACRLELWDWSSMVLDKQPKLVDLKSGEDVYVTWVEDPSNFRVIPMKFLNDLRLLEAAMQGFFSRNDGLDNLMVSGPVVGSMYAGFVDDVWRRVVIKSILPKTIFPDMVCVKAVDYGNYTVIEAAKLRQLLPPFSKLPMLALSAQLTNLKPSGTDVWAERAKEVFTAMVLNKWFTAYYDSSEADASADHTKALSLVGTKDGQFFFVHTALLQQGFAVRP